jgi:two-component system, NtrC family, sensor kinase
MEILLVDDEKHILKIIGDFLIDCGYEVCTASDGTEALQVLEKKESVGLVLSDIRMPRQDGLELLRAARVRFPGIPIVLMTGHGDEEVAVAALHEGAQDYLKKPVKLVELLDRIEQIEGRNQLESQVLGQYQKRLPSGAEPGAAPVREVWGALPPEEEIDAENASVLLIDAGVESGLQMTELLGCWGHRVVTVRSGEEGLARCGQSLFDVIVVQMGLPDIDGIELIQRLRVVDPNAMSIAITSRTDQEIAVQVLEAGGRGLLVSPLAPDALKRQVTRVLGERRRFVDSQLLLGDLLHGRADLQEKVATGERYLRYLIDAAPFGILSTDREGQITTFNGRAEQLYGFGQEEIVGFPLVHLFPSEDWASASSFDGTRPLRVRQRSKGEETFPALMHHREVLDHRGRLIARLYVVEDLTEREQMETQLLHAERLSLLGQLAPRVAHEYKTPLQVIIGQVELAQLELEEENIEPAREYLREILPAIQQMTDLSQQMATLGKPVESKEGEIDLEKEVETILDNLKNLGVVKYCQIFREFAANLPKIYGDANQIQQALRNLIVNAAQAMEGASRRELHLGLDVAEGGNGVEVVVRDVGPGIPEEHLDRVFQPFFTTKSEGKGTGLGLAIVRTVVDRHRGSIAVESEPGEGTCFRLFFPALGRSMSGKPTYGKDLRDLSEKERRSGQERR